MDDLVVYYSRWRLALLLLLSTGLAAIGLTLVGAFGEIQPLVDEPRRRLPDEFSLAAGWLLLMIQIPITLSIGTKLFDKKPQLIVDSSGIKSAHCSAALIPWTEIIDLTTWNNRGQKWIILHLRNPEQFPAKGAAGFLAKANRKLTGGDFAISLTGTDHTFDEAMLAMRHFRTESSPN